jgi:hypothetical protein
MRSLSRRRRTLDESLGHYILIMVIVIVIATAGILTIDSSGDNVRLRRRQAAHQAVSPQPVSWQSAFWGLIAIALNTMCQPSGKVLNMPSEYSFALKSSPFVCAANSVLSLATLSYYLWKKPNLIGAIQQLMKDRCKDASISLENSFASLCDNTTFRVGLFVLGALPQTIKLCAMGGIPMTQAYVVMFTISFLLDEALLALGRKASDTTDSASEDHNPPVKFAEVKELFCSISIAGSALFAMERFAEAIRGLVLTYIGALSWPFFISTSVFGLLSLCFILRANDGLIASFSILTTAGLGASLSGGVGATSTMVFRFTTAANVLITAVLAGIALYRTLYLISPKYASRVHFSLESYFLLLNLFSALLAYRFLYDPTTTSKPKWTDQLG